MGSIVKTRIAPSPTGEYHIGHIRTALYNYALANKYGGEFIVRIEDTDQKRFVEGAIDRILQDLRDYGLSWTGEICKQTDRLDIYQRYIKDLVKKGLAYYCFCSQERLDEVRETQKRNRQVPKYDRHCLNLSKEDVDKKMRSGEKYVIRMKMPDNQLVEFEDVVRGKIRINTNDLDDQVLMKSNGIPTYHFAVVIDDHLMGISHVLRGEEWISSTPKQILLYKAFNWKIPIFCHLTVFLDPEGRGKMSKRHGSVSARSFLDDGYLPEALLNFIMLLGWNSGTNQEIFSLEEFVKEFSLEKLHKKAPVFDRKKLDYFNSYYIRKLSNQDFFEKVKPFFRKELGEIDLEKLRVLAPLLKERSVTLKQAVELGKFVFCSIAFKKDIIQSKIRDKQLAGEMIGEMVSCLERADFDDYAKIQNMLVSLAEKKDYDKGDFFMALRIGLTGNSVTPPIVECLPLVGKQESIGRLDKFRDLVETL